MAFNIPATALSVTAASGAALAVGDERIACPSPAASGYWYVVVDLTDGLKVVANEFSASADTPPPGIAAHLGNPSLFLFFVAQGVAGNAVPDGELERFLAAAGSGSQLEMIEQTISQLGAEGFPSFSYALGATLNDQDLPGFEGASLFGPSVLNMQFMPLVVNGKTIYAPIQMGTSVSPTLVRAIQTPPVAAPVPVTG